MGRTRVQEQAEVADEKSMIQNLINHKGKACWVRGASMSSRHCQSGHADALVRAITAGLM